MKRLTYRHEDQCGNPTNHISQSISLRYMAREEWLEKVAVRLAAYEDTGLEPQEIEKIRQDVEAGFLKQTARRYGIDVERIRELVEADRDRRVVVLPKDGMVYYIEEAGGEKWVANKPIQQITVKCGWGLASLEFSLFDAGKWFTREAAEAALKGEQDG